MKKNKITIAAGALLLAGVTTVNAVMLHNTSERYKLINFYKDNLEYTTFADEIHSNVTCAIEEVIGEDGKLYYRLPCNFQPYYVNSDCIEIDFMKFETKDGYKYYTISGGLNMAGYIGVNERYVSDLGYRKQVIKDIENKIYEKTKPLEKFGDLYHVPVKQRLYTLNNEFRNLGESGVVQTDIEYYQIPEEIANNYVTVPKVLYDNLIRAEALEEVIKNEYYARYEKTDNHIRL